MSQQIINISNPDDGLGDALRNGFDKSNHNFTELYNSKVDKVTGKGLSENDFTNYDKTKLDGIESGAQVNVQADAAETDPLSPSYIQNFPPSLYSAVGHFHYADLATQTTPLAVVANVPKKITNDTLGVHTELDFAPYAVPTVWDDIQNSFVFSHLDLGDSASLRLDLAITTTATNQTIQLYLKFGVGTASEYDLLIDSWNEKSTVTFKHFLKTIDFSIDNQDWKNAPAELYILSDANASVKVNGFYIPIIRKSVNIIDFQYSPIYKQKNESRKFSAVLSGTDQVIEFRTAGHQHYEISGTVTSVAGFGKTLLLSSPSAEIPYAGKDIFFKNNSGHDITLNDNFSGVDVKFNLGADLIVPTKGIVWFKYDATAETLALFFKSWSDVKEVIEGYFNGTNFYTDSVFTNLITPESGKIYLNIAVTPATQYRWSGSVYVQIGGGGASEGYNPNGYKFPDSYLPFGWTQVGIHSFNLCSPSNIGDVSVRMEGGTIIVFNFSKPTLISEIYYSPGYMANPSTGGNIRNFLLKGTLIKGVSSIGEWLYPITLHDSNSGDVPMADYSSPADFFHPFKKITLNNPATVCSLFFQVQTISSGTRAVIQRILFK